MFLKVRTQNRTNKWLDEDVFVLKLNVMSFEGTINNDGCSVVCYLNPDLFCVISCDVCQFDMK